MGHIEGHARQSGSNKGEDTVLVRALAVATALLCSACANERTDPFASGRMNLMGSAQAAESPDDVPAIPRKTMASKVLSAIALERVTGLKADPQRLTEHD